MYGAKAIKPKDFSCKLLLNIKIVVAKKQINWNI